MRVGFIRAVPPFELMEIHICWDLYQYSKYFTKAR